MTVRIDRANALRRRDPGWIGNYAERALSTRSEAEIVQNQAPEMVEAGGIEPPSENRRAVATTRLFRDLISPPPRPRTGCEAASHFVFRGCAQVADGVSLAH
jgi:hypothetical protein